MAFCRRGLWLFPVQLSVLPGRHSLKKFELAQEIGHVIIAHVQNQLANGQIALLQHALEFVESKVGNILHKTLSGFFLEQRALGMSVPSATL